MKYIDITAMAIAREKKIIERAAVSAPVWDEKMVEKFNGKPINMPDKEPSRKNNAEA